MTEELKMIRKLISSHVEDWEIQMDLSDIYYRVAAMREQEDTSYRCVDYLQCYHNAIENMDRVQDKNLINEGCRAKMVSWCYKVIEFVGCRRENVALAMNFLDRFLSSKSPRVIMALVNRKEYQLVIMTSLYLVIKLFESTKINIGLLVESSCGCYADIDFITMEADILEALDWRMNGPIANTFLDHFMNLLTKKDPKSLSAYKTIRELSMYQLELALTDHFFVSHRPSSVAIAAILNSIQKIPNMLMPMPDRKNFILLIADIVQVDVMSFEIEETQQCLMNCVDKNLHIEKLKSNSKISSSTQVISTESSKVIGYSSPICVSKQIDASTMSKTRF